MNKQQRLLLLSFLTITICAFGDIEIHQAIELSIPTDTNTAYQIQTSSNLVDWVDSGSPFNGDGTTNSQFFFSTIGKPTEYYRVEETTPANLVEIDVLSYFHPFGYWGYDMYDEGVGPAINWIVVSKGATTRIGQPVILMQEYDETYLTNDQLFVSTDFSAMCQEIGGNDSGGGNHYWSKPIPILLRQFKPGETYSYPDNNRADLGDFNYSLRLDIESVTVPLGTYDCVKAIRIFEVLPPSPNAGTYVFTEWYAKNIGLVKRVQEDGTLWELDYYIKSAFIE